MPRTKKIARIDGPWPGPVFTLAQIGIWMVEEMRRYIDSMASVSEVSGAP